MIETPKQRLSNSFQYARDEFEKTPQSKAIKPIYVDLNGKISVIGTCFAARLNDEFYFVTAKHCIDRLPNNSFGISGIKKSPRLNESFYLNFDGEDSDCLIIPIDHPENLGIGEDEFLSLDTEHINFSERDWFLFYGFPSSMNKNAKISKGFESLRTATRHLRGYELKAMTGCDIDGMAFNPLIHLACAYTLTNGFEDENGSNIAQQKSPSGMSGGTLIHIGDSENLISPPYKPKLRLAGLCLGLKRGLTAQDPSGTRVRFDAMVYLKTSAIRETLLSRQ